MNKLIIIPFLFIAAFIFSFQTYSQILKVDKGDIDADSSGYFLGNIRADFNINNRSTTAEKEVTFKGLKVSADLVYVSNKHAYILINNLNYFTSTGGPLISTGYTHFRINLLRKKILSYETFAQIQYDDGRNMPLRRLAGGGVRWALARDKDYKIHIGTGIMYEYEEWKSIEDGAIITKEIPKNSSYIGFKTALNKFVRFNGIVFFQGGLDTDSNVFRSRVSGDLSLSVGLTDNLSFVTEFTAQYEDRPIININNWVYSLTNGLKWNF
ncbi:DUF481 domain-containing protein [Fulvivirga lutimaris]|uniref:DUF481 domain-containing protein n=1 Tax=Fulvivirga lutimaris TaxID=1819566 RepID=UPI0012BCF2BE|nr:DUF481 domain-containing protein [Fulvivirga lutimaris]MTI38227.1 DUF481 domain-containing protein [Fulvivirga lutimaris]